jgi:exopolysaccharide biosynthesis polyprenyl glycosylphosphotransferase
MISNKWQILKHTAKLYDLCALITAFLAATFFLRSAPAGKSLSQFFEMRISIGNCLLFALLLLAWHNIFIWSGLYVSKRLVQRRTEVLEVAQATLIASAFLFGMARVLHIQMVMVSFSFVMAFWAGCTAIMAGGRLVSRSILLHLRTRGHNTRYVLIVGTNERAIEFANCVRERPELGMQVVGFVDDEWPGLCAFEDTGHERRCDFNGLAEFLRHQIVDEAAIYLPVRSYYEHATELISLCEQHGIAIRVQTQIYNLRTQDSVGLDLEQDTHVAASSTSVTTWPSLFKRIIDFIGSTVALIVLSPLMIGVAILLKFTSEGPILFRQTRVGLNKRMFNMYKFRTMIPNAEEVQEALMSMNEMSGPVFKIKDDPRVTPLGRFLRKTSIDELPQLFNVLMGQMSLVGPRAMSRRDFQLFNTDAHRRRFSVKPGITCLWQVNGRNAIGFEQWMELDLQYIDKWSIWLDIKILARTVPAVWRGTGAA